MHLVGNLYEDYHNARSLEHRVRQCQTGKSNISIQKHQRETVQDKHGNMVQQKKHETYQLPHVQLITHDDGHRRCRNM